MSRATCPECGKPYLSRAKAIECRDRDKRRQAALDRAREQSASAKDPCFCRRSDAWRCAVDQNIVGRVSCSCGCHRPAPKITEGL